MTVAQREIILQYNNHNYNQKTKRFHPAVEMTITTYAEVPQIHTLCLMK